MQKTLNDTRKFATMVAQHQGWKLNPDQEFVEMLLEGLTTNFNRYGYFLCPCRDGDGQKASDKDIVCPCDYCVPDQMEYGHCYCGLYLTPDFFATRQEPKAIPERRPE